MKPSLLFPILLFTALLTGGCDDSSSVSLPFTQPKLPESLKTAMQSVRDDLASVETLNPKDLREANRRISKLRDSWKQLELVWPLGEYAPQRLEAARAVHGFAIYSETFANGYPEAQVVTDFAATVDDAERKEVMRLYKSLAGGGDQAQVAFAREVMEQTSVYKARTGLESILDGKAKK